MSAPAGFNAAELAILSEFIGKLESLLEGLGTLAEQGQCLGAELTLWRSGDEVARITDMDGDGLRLIPKEYEA